MFDPDYRDGRPIDTATSEAISSQARCHGEMLVMICSREILEC
jgi:hypothetical protein